MALLISTLLFISLSSVMSLIMGGMHGKFSAFIFGVSLVAAFCTACFANKRLKGISLPFKASSFGTYTWLTIGVFSLFALRSFFWIIFKKGDELAVLSPNNLGDLALHITHVQYFASGSKVWPDNPIFTGAKLHYPFGMDLFNAALVSLGANPVETFVWVGLFCSILTCLALLSWGGGFTLAGFLFNGGLAGFMILKTFQWLDYQKDLAWKSIPLALFVTQRGFLFALPVGLVLLWSWKNRFFRPSERQLPLWIEVILYATLPLFHMHSFIFLSLFLACLLFFVSRECQKKIIYLVLYSVPIATPIVLLLTDFLQSSSFVRIKWGWMQESQNFFWFWINNFGIFVPTLFVLAYFVYKSKKAEDRAFVFSALGLFVIFLNVMMAPWEWDNTKLLIWSYLIILPFIWDYVVLKIPKHFQQSFIVFLYFSGFVSLFGGIGPQHRGYELFKLAEIRGVQSGLSNLPLEERIAGVATYNHPLFFSGRKMALGYAGHLWSHGLNAEEKTKKLKSLMLGEFGWKERAKELGVRYIFWGSREKQEFSGSSKPWEEKPPVASGSWGSLYELGNL